MAEHYPIRAIRVADFDALHAVGEHAFHDPPPTPHHRAQMLSRLELDRSLGALCQHLFLINERAVHVRQDQ